MAKGDTKRGMIGHFQQIVDRWEGKECTHKKITETIDDNGQIIDRSEATATVHGIIAPIGIDDIQHSTGTIEPEDLYGFFWYTDSITAADRVSATQMRHDHIIYEGTEYNVEKAMSLAFDLDEPVFMQFLLRKVPV
jgi:hypothetical protein